MFQIPIDADVSIGFDYKYKISYAASNAKGYMFSCITTHDDETEVTWAEVVEVGDDNKPSKGNKWICLSKC